MHFWDKDVRMRLKSMSFYIILTFTPLIRLRLAFDAVQGPIVSTGFNYNGSIFAYAVSYDWSKGHTGMTPGHPNKILLHACKDEEVKKRPARK